MTTCPLVQTDHVLLAAIIGLAPVAPAEASPGQSNGPAGAQSPVGTRS